MNIGYYDAVVLGVELGPLVAGALLAKRGFRVLVVGQRAPADRYECYGYQFARRPFLFVSAESPAVRRVLNELGLGQVFLHAIREVEPLYQIILPHARIDVSSDLGMTLAEIERELPLYRARTGDILGYLGRINGEVDKLLANDIVIPSETFLEKREYARAAVQNPFHSGFRLEPILPSPDEDELRAFFELPMRFTTGETAAWPPLVRARQMGSWLFDCRHLKGGRDGVRKLLIEHIVAQGGDQHLNQKVSEIIVSRGKVTGVRIAEREEITDCKVVLADLTPRELAPLISPDAWTKRFRELCENSPRARLAYALNLGLSSEVVPEGLAQTAFVSFGSGLGDELLRIERIQQKDDKRAALNVSCIVPDGQEEAIFSGALRDAMLDRLRSFIPFLDSYLKVIHSSYDGFGAIDLTGCAEGETPPIPHAEEIPRWYVRLPVAESALGIENLPHRTGIKGLLLSGAQVVSGLGTEGEWLAAWGAARIAGKMDPDRERIARAMRGKVEI